VIDVAKLLSLVVLLSDDYLRIRGSEQPENEQKAIRFFQINLKLPLELQTIVCNYTFDQLAITFSTSDFDQGLKDMIKLIQ